MQTNKRATESFIVNLAGQTTMPTSGFIYNASTSNVNLANGQLGVVSDSIYGTRAFNNFTDATPTIAEAPVLAIYQGTSDSASMASASAAYPLWVRPFERTNSIDGRTTVRVTKQAYQDPSHSVWRLGAVVGETDAVNVLDETTYTVAVALRGRRVQYTHSFEEAATLHASVTTPNFTDLGYSAAQATDYILTYLGWNINRNSYVLNMNSRFPAKWPVIAFLVDSAGTSGDVIDAMAAGDTLVVVNTATGSRSITLTQAMVDSLQAADPVPGTATIVPIDLTEAGEIVTSAADHLLIMGLDERVAYSDKIPQVKTALQVGLTSGFNFNTVANTQESFAFEGSGLSRQLELLYQATQGQRKYNLEHTEDPIVKFPSPIVNGQTYVVYNIVHGRQEEVDTFNTIYSPYREIICIPRYSSGTTDNALISTFDGVLNSWLASSSNGSIVTP